MEIKQGISQLELLFQEFSREDRLKQKRKQARKLKKRRKKERKNAVSVSASGHEDDDEVIKFPPRFRLTYFSDKIIPHGSTSSSKQFAFQLSFPNDDSSTTKRSPNSGANAGITLINL